MQTIAEALVNPDSVIGQATMVQLDHRAEGSAVDRTGTRYRRHGHAGTPPSSDAPHSFVYFAFAKFRFRLLSY
jgi:hypothetical protein